MKEMIQSIIDIESKTYNQEQLYMLTSLKVTALMLLEKEKEQIMKAYDLCEYNQGCKGDAEQYYTKIYQQ